MSNKPIKLWQYLVPIVVLLAIWFYPVPEGLKPQAWHMFAIFVATIVGILCARLNVHRAGSFYFHQHAKF